MGTQGSWWWFPSPLPGIKRDSGCLSTQPWALLRDGWGFRAYSRNPKEKIPCGFGGMGFWEPAAAVAQCGQSGAPLGQFLPFLAEMLQPWAEAEVLDAVSLLYLWLGVFSGWQWQ